MIENPMVLDSHWRHLEKPEPKVVGECAGCEEDIYAHEQWLDLVSLKGDYLVHQNTECCYQFVVEMSVCRGGEEE